MHKYFFIFVMSLFFYNSSSAFAKDPIIVWPTETGISKIDIKTVSGSWISSSENKDQNEVEVWSLKLTKIQYSIRAVVTSSKKDREVYTGYLLPQQKAYYGILRSYKGGVLRVILFQTATGLKARIFENGESFEDFELHHASEVEKNGR